MQSQCICKCAAVGGTRLQSCGACNHSRCALRCCWQCRTAEPRGLQSQSIYNALLLAAQGCKATEPAVTVDVHCAAVGSAGLQSHGACSHNQYANALLPAAQGCRATEPAVTVDVHCAAVGSAGLQSHGACSQNLYTMRCCSRHRAATLRARSHSPCALRCLGSACRAAEPRGLQSQSIYSALLLAAQGGRATEPAVTVHVHCAAVRRAGLQSHGACSHNYYANALLLAAQGCRAMEPEVSADARCAAVGSAGLQSHGACSHNLYTVRCCWRHRAAELRGLQSQSMCTALLLGVQGCRATGPAVTIIMQMRCFWRHKAAELWSLKSQPMRTARLLAVQGCRATGPAVKINI